MTTMTTIAARVSLPRVVRGEWIKMWGQRFTWWILGLTLLVPPLVTLVWAGNTTPVSPARIDQVDAVIGSTTSSVFEVLVLLVLFGSLVASNEFDSRTISTTMAAVPRRWPVVIAKSIIVFGVSALVGVIINTVGFLLSSAVIETTSPVTLGDTGVLGVILGATLFESCVALIALSIALVLRSSLAAVAATFGFIYVLPGAVNLIPFLPIQLFSKTFPGPASSTLTAVLPSSSDLPYVASGIALVLWSIIWVAIAVAVIRRRDV